MYRDTHTLKCPYCGELAPYGDERIVWLSAHLDSWWHHAWWVLMRPIFQGLVVVFRFFVGVFETRDYLTIALIFSLALMLATVVFATVETFILAMAILILIHVAEYIIRRRNKNW